jgi:hypothetical protein
VFTDAELIQSGKKIGPRVFSTVLPPSNLVLVVSCRRFVAHYR